MDLRRIIIIALCAALIVVGAYVAIPVGPVPVTLQTVFILLAGILGGRSIGLAAVATYLVLGAMGLPVFSGGIGGFAHFAGPTGGFLIGSLVAATVAGLFADRGFSKPMTGDSTTKMQLVWIIAGTIAGTLIIYLIGIPYLKMVLNIPWSQAFTIGLLPFIPGDLVKLVAIVLLGNMFAPRVRQFVQSTSSGDEDEQEPGA